MSSDLAIVQAVPEVGSNLPVTRADLDQIIEQRKLFHEFVRSQMKLDVDYGVVPGTQKQSLYKPGAEKLMRLFGLGFRIRLVDKEFDREANFALFNYRAEIYLLRHDSVIVAECEGSCNSQEKKYRERKVWEWDERLRRKVERPAEQTPICDILNTLQKMAQKRAFVGAVILATAASDFFTHDIDDAEDADQLGLPPADRPAPQSASVKVPQSIKAKSQHQGAPAAETFGAFDDGPPVQPAPKELTRAELGNAIWEAGKALGYTLDGLNGLAQKNYKKSPTAMTAGEMQHFLNSLQSKKKGGT